MKPWQPILFYADKVPIPSHESGVKDKWDKALTQHSTIDNSSSPYRKSFFIAPSKATLDNCLSVKIF
jgi:hypothetical protein